MTPRIYLSSPTMHGEEQKFIQEAFDTNWVAPLGPNVDAFEDEVCGYLEETAEEAALRQAQGPWSGEPSVYGAALSSGTAALHLAVKLAGVQEGDIVFAQSLTFAASVNPVMYEKAVPVFIDSEPETWNLSPAALEEAFDKYPDCKCVIAVHLYGTPCQWDEIRAICNAHGATLIEDAAEALGASYQGRKCGTLGDFNILSFNGNKIITTSGGGMLVSRDEEKIARARFLSTQARDPAPHYEHSTVGYNYRMSNIVAGIGRGQLLHLAEHVARKKEIYQYYTEAFRDIDGITMNPLNEDGEANRWLSCILLDSDAKATPSDLMAHLAGRRIEARPIWKPMHLQPVYRGYDFFKDPAAERLCVDSIAGDIFERGLCLPSDIKMTEEDLEEVVEVVRGLASPRAGLLSSQAR